MLRRTNQMDTIFTENGCDNVPVRAWRGGIDLGLVVLQTNTEPCPTRSGTRAGPRGSSPTTALTNTVFAIVVDE
jgi:hypothetical protein